MNRAGVVDPRDHVEVGGWPRDKAGEQQRTATDDRQPVAEVTALEQLSKSD